MSGENNNFLNEDQSAKEQNEVEISSDEVATEEGSDVVSFDDSCVTESTEGYEDRSSRPEKKKRNISFKTLAVSIITAFVAAIMLTYWICGSIYQSMYAQAYVDANRNNVNGSSFSKIDILSQIVNSYSYTKLNEDEMMEAAIKAYIEASDDVYATYYTKADLEAESSSGDEGKMTGIGINIINDVIEYNGEELFVLRVANVMKDSPALEAGILSGDLIFEVEIDGDMKLIDDIGFSVALDKMVGKAGSKAKLSVLRKSGGSYEIKTFEATRREVNTISVYERVYSKNPEVGVIRISTFEETTPAQFEEAIKTLKAQGCNKFVLDLRDNLGGSFAAVEKILSFFLNDGDTFLQVKTNTGETTKYKLTENSIFADKASACSIKKEDIGKYKDLNIVILCNEYTARNSELFVSVFKDYGIAPIVGTKTYGDGLLQRMIYLSDFVSGLDGAVALSTDEMLSPYGNSFNGSGIKLDVDKTVPINKEAENLNLFELSDDLDNQLQKAVNFFK